jgi:rfaE bifunctional protein nucleotidyltransferase chain/domain
VLGDTLLDRDVEGVVDRLCPGLAALIAATTGDDVVLVTALSPDRPGRELAGLLTEGGVAVVDLGLDGPTPEKIRVRCDGQSLLRLDRGYRPARPGPLAPQAEAALARASAVLIADYGRGLADRADVRDALGDVARRRPLVWDPHPRGSEPVPGVRLATPNEGEAARIAPELGGVGLTAVANRARALRRRWRAHAVAVTLGRYGAMLTEGDGAPMVVPTRPVSGDSCGAGDHFAVTAAALLASGALPSEAVAAAVSAASAFVAAGGATAVRREPAGQGRPNNDSGRVEDLARRVRTAGGTVVATGGCFDLLHAGHVALLQAARMLGDCLVVCLNSDASVRGLKGAGRPFVPAADRIAVLSALGCVDGVAVFDEPTPGEVLRGLRPHVFAKGGDYAGTRLPEAEVVAAWGGQVVVLPYLEGRSTSGLV